jgi:hypothetical protein
VNGQGQIDSLDFTLPGLGDGPLATSQEVLLDLVEAGHHLGVDAEHPAADAGFSELVKPLCGNIA